MPWIFGGFADIEIPNLIIRRQDFPSRKDNCSSRKKIHCPSCLVLPMLPCEEALWGEAMSMFFFVVVVGWIAFQLGSGCRDVLQNARKHSKLRCVNPRKSQPLAIVGGSRLGRFTVYYFRWWVETNHQPVSLSEGHGPSNGAIIFSGFLSGTSGVKPEDVQLCGVATPNCIAWSESDRADLDGFHVL